MTDASAGAAGIDQPAIGIVVAEEQRPEPGPGPFGIGPADHHELLAIEAFHFKPQTAITGGVGRVDPLRDGPFDLQRASMIVEGTPAPDLVIAVVQGPACL